MPEENEQAIESETASPIYEIQNLLKKGTKSELEHYIDQLGFSEMLRAFSRLDHDEQTKLLLKISPADAAEFLEDVPDTFASELVEKLTAKEAASIVTEMESSEQADLLGDIQEDNAEAILAEMKPEDAEEVRELSTYADDEAGGLMITEILKFDISATVIDVIDHLESISNKDKYFDTYIYITSRYGKIAGVLSLRDLLLAHKATKLQDILKPARCVKTNTKFEFLKGYFEDNDFYAAPVVDEDQLLVGVVRRRDLTEAIFKLTESQQLKAAGLVVGEEMRTMPVVVRSRRRLSWLSINIFLNIISASVIALYTDTLTAVIALVVFLPIVSDMSGCSGNQAVAVSMRELALGLVRPYEVFRVWIQEIKVGAINGCILGILLGGIAWLWKGNPYLGVVIGSALAINTVIAVSIGGTVPLILKRMNIDPAVASGPVLTTVTDLCGFFLVLSIATLMLPVL
jgi:magnesium transporter